MKKTLRTCVLSLFFLALLPAATWASPCPPTGCNVLPSTFGTLLASTPDLALSGHGVKLNITSSVYFSGGIYTYVYQLTAFGPTQAIHNVSVGDGLFDTTNLKFGFLKCAACTPNAATFAEIPGGPGLGTFLLHLIASSPKGEKVTFYAQSRHPFTTVDFSARGGWGGISADDGVLAPAVPEPTSATLLLTLVGCLTLMGGCRVGWRRLTSV